MSPALGVAGQGRLNIKGKFRPKKSGPRAIPQSGICGINSAKQAGKKEGGRGEGIFARLPKRSPAALLVQSRTQQKSFLFLLEEKIGWAQIKKCEENFFAGWRASASGGGAERQSSQSGFSSKKVRILTKRHRQN